MGVVIYVSGELEVCDYTNEGVPEDLAEEAAIETPRAAEELQYEYGQDSENSDSSFHRFLAT